MKALLIAALCIVIAGCSSLGSFGQQSNGGQPMTAAELKEMVKNKDGAVVCVVLPTPWGIMHMTTVNLDQAPRTTAGIAVDPNCKVDMNTSTPPPAAREPQPPKEKANG